MTTRADLIPDVNLLSYTDRPFTINTVTGQLDPPNGFKGVGDSYTINDAWMSENDMGEYALTTEEVLRLKMCFDRINRKVRKRANDSVGPTNPWRYKQEQLKTVFNRKYLDLRQLAIKTAYRYNMRRYIVTPPIRQCTHHYDSLLRRLCRLDSMSPEELQCKKIYLPRDKNARNYYNSQAAREGDSCPVTDGRNTDVTSCEPSATGAVALRKQRASRRKRRRNAKPYATDKGGSMSMINNAAIQKLWKVLNDAELVNKSIKDQTQGGKSFMKQVVVPGKMLNCLYGKVLPNPNLKPHMIGLPSNVMENTFQCGDQNKVAAVGKRDPVLSSDSPTTFTVAVRNPYSYVTVPPETMPNKNMDIDGDTKSILLCHSSKCVIETLMALSARITMYCYFYRTRITFSQTSAFRIAGLLQHLESTAEDQDALSHTIAVENKLGWTFAACRKYVFPERKVSQQLVETLISLSQQYGPFVAYGYMMNVRHLCFFGYNEKRIYPISDDPIAMVTHIAESGSKGTVDGVKRMFAYTTTKETLARETLDYAKTFIKAKTLIRTQGHNAKKMDSAFQNIVIDHDYNLTMKANNVIYNMGHIINYIQLDWMFSELTLYCILHGTSELEHVFKDAACQCSCEKMIGSAYDGAIIPKPSIPPFQRSGRHTKVQNDLHTATGYNVAGAEQMSRNTIERDRSPSKDVMPASPHVSRDNDIARAQGETTGSNRGFATSGDDPEHVHVQLESIVRSWEYVIIKLFDTKRIPEVRNLCEHGSSPVTTG